MGPLSSAVVTFTRLPIPLPFLQRSSRYRWTDCWMAYSKLELDTTKYSIKCPSHFVY